MFLFFKLFVWWFIFSVPSIKLVFLCRMKSPWLQFIINTYKSCSFPLQSSLIFFFLFIILFFVKDSLYGVMNTASSSVLCIPKLLRINSKCSHHKNYLRWGWRDDSVVKSTVCSSREPEFNSQPLHGSSQLSVIFRGLNTHGKTPMHDR